MYTTKRLSLYKNHPEALSLPPQGPNSGILVIQDEESTNTCLFGLLYDSTIRDLPFPQNKRLSIRYSRNSTSYDNREYSRTSINDIYLIPIINQPLSSNRYYAINADWIHKGEAHISSKEQDRITIAGHRIPWILDVDRRPPFDPNNMYQQFEFSTKNSLTRRRKILLAKSVASDGFPPKFFRRKGWKMKCKSIENSTLREARGIDSSLRAHLPSMKFPLSQECSSSMVVGKWYCPFMFIKEWKEKEWNQVKNSLFYEITLEQRWERIYATNRNLNQGKNVLVDVVVPTETVKIEGQHVVQQGGVHNGSQGMVYYKSVDGLGIEKWVGLSSLIVERMLWEENRVGWINEKEKQVSVFKDEKYAGIGDWTTFGCYLLVESFVLKRNNGSVVLTYEFRHVHQIRSKWE